MTNNSPKSKIIAILLCVFLGGLGIHRFYLGYTVIGVIQLLTIGGCGIWALVDLVLIAIGSLNDKDGQPLVQATQSIYITNSYGYFTEYSC